MSWYAHITENRDWPPLEKPGIIHLQNLKAIGREDADVSDPNAFRAYLAANPHVGKVMVYDSRFPRRGTSLEVFLSRWAKKIWPGFSPAVSEKE